MQAKFNRELPGLGADLTSTDVNEGYIKHIKSKTNSMVPDTETNNVLPPQEPAHNDNDDALAGAAAALSLLLPPTDNSNGQHINLNNMKCYYDHTHCHFLGFFNDPILDDAVIYTGNITFQYNKIESSYTKFIGKPLCSVFIVVKRYHEFLISQGGNKLNMSSDSIQFGPHNTNKNCTNFVQVAPVHTSDLSHFTYHTQRLDADVEYLGRVKMAMHSHVGSIDFADPANI